MSDLKNITRLIHCGCYVSDDDPTLAANDKCVAFELYEACEKALACIDNAYNELFGALDMNTEVGRDVEFIKAAMKKFRGEQ